MSHPHGAHRAHKVSRHRAKQMLHGYKKGGAVHDDEAQDRKLFNKMFAEKKGDMKVEGKKSGGRLDKYARGGRTKHKKPGTQVNIAIVSPHGHQSPGGPAAPAGGPPSPGGPPPMPPKPPMMPPPGAGAMPPPGMKPPGMMKRGGRVKMTAGAESGEGRLQKAKHAKHGK